jgi:hypothetical protein
MAMFTNFNIRIVPEPGTMRRLEWEVGAARSTGRVIDAAELDSMLQEAGALCAADILSSAAQAGVISAETLAGVIGNIWQFCYPNGPGRDGWDLDVPQGWLHSQLQAGTTTR